MVVAHTLPRGTPSLATAIGVVLTSAIAFLVMRPVMGNAEQLVLSEGPSEMAPAGADTDAPAVITSYRVRPGDTLSEIAELHSVPTAAIIDRNRLASPYRLMPGARLAIPTVPGGSLPPASLRSPHAAEVASAAARWGPAYGVSPALMKALAWKESRWEPRAVSNKGALGAAQVLPETARWVSTHLVGAQLDPLDVDDNLRLSAAYLRWLTDRSGGDMAAALAAYYQGRSSTLSEGWLPSTEQYVRDVFVLWAGFRGESENSTDAQLALS